MSRNELRALAPKRSRHSTGKREAQYRTEFLASASASKLALRELLDGNGRSVELPDGTTIHYVEFAIELGSYSFIMKDSLKIAYEGIRRYGIQRDEEEIPRYVRIPGTSRDPRRFSNAFSVARFASFIENDEGETEFIEDLPKAGTIIEELPIILSLKSEWNERLDEWNWIDVPVTE